MYNHLLNELASYSAKELDALWDELKDFNKIGPYASDFFDKSFLCQNIYEIIYPETYSRGYVG